MYSRVSFILQRTKRSVCKSVNLLENKKEFKALFLFFSRNKERPREITSGDRHYQVVDLKPLNQPFQKPKNRPTNS